MRTPYRYIQCFKNSKTGKIYRYFRRPGMRRVRLFAEFGTTEFFAQYAAAYNGEEIGRRRPPKRLMQIAAYEVLLEKGYLHELLG